MQLLGVGVLNVIATDILLKLKNLVELLLAPLNFCGRRGKATRKNIRSKLSVWMEQTLDMNQFEIKNFKQQSIYAQLLFEDSLMILLDSLIFLGVLKVPKIWE